jgi:hypothetical protein
MKFKAELVDYYLAHKDTTTISEIASKVSREENGINLTTGTAQNYLYRIKREQSKVISIDNTPKWRTQGDKYLFDDQHGDIKVFSIEMIDRIFLFYVSRGYNFTRSAVQQRFDLTPENFNKIANVFHLSKQSDIFSPYTKQTTKIDELESLADTLMQEIINSGEMTSRKRREALERQYKKVIDKDNMELVWRNTVIDELLSEYAQCEHIVLQTCPARDTFGDISVQIADIHAGSKAEKMKITQDWSIADMEEKLDRVAKRVNSYGAARVHLNFLGDYVETISGVNHPDSWKLIEDGKWGGEAIIFAYEVLSRFISKVNNVKSINGVGGNHDRLQGSNKLADDGASKLIFYMIEKEMAETNVDVNYDASLLSLDLPTWGDILCHGDKGLHKQPIHKLILAFAKDKNKFQFIDTGHYHAFMVKNGDSVMDGRRTTNPSILTGNDFSDNTLGVSDRSGFSVHFMNEWGEPEQTIHNI